jgi:thiamine-monophosphate kinase
LNEFELIKKYFVGWPSKEGTQPLLGIGDDAALVDVPPNKHLVVAADTLVASRHFPEGADAAQIASRALRVNLSDMAAMGATPLHYTLCLTLPDTNEDWLASFAARLRDESSEFGCALIGGDTTKGELCISLQMMGLVDAGRALKRSTASVGDSIWVTGTLGDAAGYIASDFAIDESVAALASRFWLPEPRLKFAHIAEAYIESCIDVSDGLLADLGHICSASGVAAELNLDKVPLSKELVALAAGNALNLALTGGDDYELCFTAKPDAEQKLTELAAAENIRLTKIGIICDGAGVECLDSEGGRLAINQRGYSHF